MRFILMLMYVKYFIIFKLGNDGEGCTSSSRTERISSFSATSLKHKFPLCILLEHLSSHKEENALLVAIAFMLLHRP